jgi:hypothetical protein
MPSAASSAGRPVSLLSTATMIPLNILRTASVKRATHLKESMPVQASSSGHGACRNGCCKMVCRHDVCLVGTPPYRFLPVIRAACL